MIRTIAVVAVAALALTACTEQGYVVTKILVEPDTGRNYIVCERAGSLPVEVTVSANYAYDTKVGAACYDQDVEGGTTITPAPPSSVVSPTAVTP